VLLEDPKNVLEAFAAIHRPPGSAWSSHRAYLSLEKIPWLTQELIRSLLAIPPGAGMAAYDALLEREPPWNPLDNSWRGKSSRLNRHDRPYDIFAQWLKSGSRERAKPATLDQLIRAVAQWFQVDPAAIAANEPGPLLSLARAIIVWYAMQNEIASLA
jgi:hypothetical protein